MSIKKLVSVKTPIIDACDNLGIDHNHDRPVFTRWARLAENAIHSLPALRRKRAVLAIKGCVAVLPHDAKFVQRAILGDAGTECEDLFNTISTQLAAVNLESVSTSESFLIVDMGSTFASVCGSIPHQIQDNKIVLSHNYDGQALTIQYYGYEVDEEGFIKVCDNHVPAITWYIQWQYWMRKRNINSMEYGKMNVCRDEWNRECSNARALDTELTESDRAEITEMMHDPYIGISVNVGMYPTSGYGY